MRTYVIVDNGVKSHTSLQKTLPVLLQLRARVHRNVTRLKPCMQQKEQGLSECTSTKNLLVGHILLDSKLLPAYRDLYLVADEGVEDLI